MQVFISCIVGLVLGLLCGFMRLPIPAPPNFAGVAAIIAIYVGYSITIGRLN